MNGDPVEDRIRMDAVDPAGMTQTIWLTRRLAEGCVPHLAQHAETHVRHNLPRDLALTMNQQQLRSRREENPIQAVRPSADAPVWLCRTMHLTPDANGGLAWTLTDDQDHEAVMSLTEEAVRAILDVFLTTFRALKWSDALFAEWLREAAAPVAREPGLLN